MTQKKWTSVSITVETAEKLTKLTARFRDFFPTKGKYLEALIEQRYIEEFP